MNHLGTMDMRLCPLCRAPVERYSPLVRPLPSKPGVLKAKQSGSGEEARTADRAERFQPGAPPTGAGRPATDSSRRRAATLLPPIHRHQTSGTTESTTRASEAPSDAEDRAYAVVSDEKREEVAVEEWTLTKCLPADTEPEPGQEKGPDQAQDVLETDVADADQECLVCSTEPADPSLLPCRHPVCRPCLASLRRHETCPVCRDLRVPAGQENRTRTMKPQPDQRRGAKPTDEEREKKFREVVAKVRAGRMRRRQEQENESQSQHLSMSASYVSNEDACPVCCFNLPDQFLVPCLHHMCLDCCQAMYPPRHSVWPDRGILGPEEVPHSDERDETEEEAGVFPASTNANANSSTGSEPRLWGNHLWRSIHASANHVQLPSVLDALAILSHCSSRSTFSSSSWGSSFSFRDSLAHFEPDAPSPPPPKPRAFPPARPGPAPRPRNHPNHGGGRGRSNKN